MIGIGAAPVALPREAPVAEPVVDRRLPLAVGAQRLDDRALRLVRRLPVELAGVDQDPVVADHRHDRQVELLRELVVALVVRRHGHDRARAVLHQHVVRDPDRDLRAVDRVGRVAAGEDARLLPLLALLGRPGRSDARVRQHLLVVGELLHERRLGRDHEERRTEQRVGPRREDRDVEVELLDAEEDLRALGAPDPQV